MRRPKPRIVHLITGLKAGRVVAAATHMLGSYRVVSELTGENIPKLCYYSVGSAVPKYDKARRLIDVIARSLSGRVAAAILSGSVDWAVAAVVDAWLTVRALEWALSGDAGSLAYDPTSELSAAAAWQLGGVLAETPVDYRRGPPKPIVVLARLTASDVDHLRGAAIVVAAVADSEAAEALRGRLSALAIIPPKAREQAVQAPEPENAAAPTAR